MLAGREQGSQPFAGVSVEGLRVGELCRAGPVPAGKKEEEDERHGSSRESKKCPFTSDFKVGVTSAVKDQRSKSPTLIKDQRSKSPTAAQRQDPWKTLPRPSSPTVTVRPGSQRALGAGGQRMEHGSHPWRDRQ